MVLQSINLGVAFLLELCMLGALAYWGFRTSDNLLVQLLLGLGTPLLAIVIWARFMAPKSKSRLTGVAYLLVKLILFGAATFGLVTVGQTTLAIIFAVATVINQILLIVWKQDTPSMGG